MNDSHWRQLSARRRRALGIAAAGLLGSLGLGAGPAQAFCGFFVSGADAELVNNASQVVLLRKGNRTARRSPSQRRIPSVSAADEMPANQGLSRGNRNSLDGEARSVP